MTIEPTWPGDRRLDRARLRSEEDTTSQAKRATTVSVTDSAADTDVIVLGVGMAGEVFSLQLLDAEVGGVQRYPNSIQLNPKGTPTDPIVWDFGPVLH